MSTNARWYLRKLNVDALLPVSAEAFFADLQGRSINNANRGSCGKRAYKCNIFSVSTGKPVFPRTSLKAVTPCKSQASSSRLSFLSYLVTSSRHLMLHHCFRSWLMPAFVTVDAVCSVLEWGKTQRVDALPFVACVVDARPGRSLLLHAHAPIFTLPRWPSHWTRWLYQWTKFMDAARYSLAFQPTHKQADAHVSVPLLFSLWQGFSHLLC